MGLKKAQISVIEAIFVLLLISTFFYLFLNNFEFNLDIESNSNLNSYLTVLVQNDSFRDLILVENLSDVSLDGDWSSFSSKFNLSFGNTNYYLAISNSSNQKVIFSCDYIYGKDIVEDIISISNLTNYNFREIYFGVCY